MLESQSRALKHRKIA